MLLPLLAFDLPTSSFALLTLSIVVLTAASALAVFVGMGRAPPAKAPPDLTIDLTSLSQAGPPETGAVVECHGVPMRLGVFVMAPLGRSTFPPHETLMDVLEDFLPGLGDVLISHDTLIRRWPSQLSPRGFSQFFFSTARLPGDRGKGTPWCSVAGKLELGGDNLMLGMVLCADAPNGLSAMAIEGDTQWGEIVRVTRRP